jgi:hypothetical protein
MTTGSAPKQVTATVQPKSTAERALRVGREAAIIARAHAEIDAGLGVEDDDLETWLDRLDQDENTPAPIGVGQTVRP